MNSRRFLAATSLAVVCAAPPAATTFAGGFVPDHQLNGLLPAVDLVEVAAGAFNYPMPGEFLADGRPSNAPIESQSVRRTIAIMKYQVSLADYQRCVDAGACEPADAIQSSDVEIISVTGVNFFDAQAYASWYSRATNENWRLPTDVEWAFAASERFVGESYSTVAGNPDNPAIAWIRRYEEEAAARRPPDPKAHPQGWFGPNTRGIYDLAGNIWEWTSTCYLRTTLDAGTGSITHKTENCRVHIAEGRHRTYMSDFVRDGVSGGCAVGTPPDNLGFRLVREARRTLPERLLDFWRIVRGQTLS